MNEELNVKLENAIEDELNAMENILEVGSDGYSNAVEDVTKMAKVLNDAEDRRLEREGELALKDKERKTSRTLGILRILGDVALGAAGLFAYDKWFNAGMLFEKDGNVPTSTFFKNLLNGINKKGKV